MNCNLKKLLVAVLAVGALVGTNASAADATIGLDLNSAYVWRGLTFNDSFVAQPSIDVAGPAGFGFNVWGNFDLDDYIIGDEAVVESGEFSEVDLAISYAIPEQIENADFGIGVIEYLFPVFEGGSTREVYGETAVDLGMGIIAGLFFAYDFDAVNDYYANASLAYGYDLYDELSLEFSGLIGYVGSDWAAASSGGTSGGFHEYQFTLAGDYGVSEVTSLGAFVSYVGSADTEVLASTDVEWLGGLNVYYNF